MPGRSTVKDVLPLVIFIALVLPNILNGQQACGKSLNELKNWVYAPPSPVHRMPALPYPALVDSLDWIKAIPETSLYPRYFLQENAAPQAIFCRLEHQLAQKIRVPFKFRLGSVQYVDWLEGKPGANAFPY